jgi:hypothetical protein
MTLSSYEKLAKLAQQLVDTDSLGEIDHLSAAPLRKLLQKNQQTLELARLELSPSCCVPLDYSRDFFAAHCECLTPLRDLGRAFYLESVVARLSKDFRTAAKAGLTILELANAVRRGGLIVDSQVCNAIAAMGTRCLGTIRSQLDSGTRRFVIADLLRLETQRETYAQIAERDRHWEESTGYADEPIDFSKLSIEAPDEADLSEEDQIAIQTFLQVIQQLPATSQNTIKIHQDLQPLAYMRLLAVDLALREFESLSGTFPTQLSELLPEILHEVPRDPFTNQMFAYQKLGEDSFDLICLGPQLDGSERNYTSWVLEGFTALSLNMLEE